MFSGTASKSFVPKGTHVQGHLYKHAHEWAHVLMCPCVCMCARVCVSIGVHMCLVHERTGSHKCVPQRCMPLNSIQGALHQWYHHHLHRSLSIAASDPYQSMSIRAGQRASAVCLTRQRVQSCVLNTMYLVLHSGYAFSSCMPTHPPVSLHPSVPLSAGAWR